LQLKSLTLASLAIMSKVPDGAYYNNKKKIFKNEKKLTKMEEKRPNEMEMAT